MADIRIETSQATLHQFQTGEPDVFTALEMDQEVTAYWGSLAAEKLFLIPFWRANELLAQSPTNQIAFKVSNIEDPALVSAEWISYDASNPTAGAGAPGGLIGFLQGLIDSLKDLISPAPPIALFVFGEELFPLSGNGGLKQFLPHHLQTILGRIGRRSSGETAAFFVVGTLDIKKTPGGGGPGTATGAKVPSDDDE